MSTRYMKFCFRFSAFLFALGLLVANPVIAGQAIDQAKWDATVAAAKKEGKITISGPQSRIWSGALELFEKDYPGIKVEVTPFIGNDFWPRFQKERELGKYLWDVRIGGMDTSVWKLKHEGVMAPVRPLFMLSEALDEKNWFGGFDNMYLDNDKKYFPTFCAQKSDSASVNRDVIPVEEFSSIDQIVDPKWKGKIAMADPRGGGAAIVMSVIYKKYGADFVRKLMVDQAPVMTKNPRQILEWFASGKYPIAIGISSGAAEQFKKSNIRLNASELSGVRLWSPGVCAVMLPKQQPHPHATTVFLNWLFTKKAQMAIMDIAKVNSRMKDVPWGQPDRGIDYSHLSEYVSGQTEDFQDSTSATRNLVKTLLP